MKKKIFSNIFSRSRTSSGKLETDAVPVDDPMENGSFNLDNTNNNLSMNSTDLNAALQLQAEMVESSDLAVVRTNTSNEIVESPAGNTTVTNNQMAVHNTQGQVVMQFSNITGLHFGSVYNFNSEKLEQPTTEGIPTTSTARSTAGSGRPRRTTTIEAMMKSSEELNHRMLDTISTHLGEGWKNVLRDLNFTDGQIEQAIIDNQMHGGIKEVIYQLLLGWTRNAEEGEATLGVITHFLWKSGHRECVQKMKEAWKQDNAAKNLP